MLTRFEDERNNLAQNIELLLELSSKRKNEEIKKRLEILKEKLFANSFFIAAFGGFSSGKSTFFNALIGEKVFPSLHTPTTASINFLKYGKQKQIIINYKTKQEIQEAKKSGLEEYKNAKVSFKLAGKKEFRELEFLKEISRENVKNIKNRVFYLLGYISQKTP